MLHRNRNYTNFVPACSVDQESQNKITRISGEEAKRLYLEEVKDANTSICSVDCGIGKEPKKNIEYREQPTLSNKDLFLCVENNNVDILQHVLNKDPERVNIVDDFGWSLLMIACQANSVETAKELLKRGIDLSIRDKAGNSAHSLVIKNKNYVLADILLKYRENETLPRSKKKDIELQKFADEYVCEICNKNFPNKQEHLSSTIHNIHASKGKKTSAHYVIPASNKGYQLMLKGGWDRDSGLGRDGHGKKYPIKTIKKNDRKGLGHNVTKPQEKKILLEEDSVKTKSRRIYIENLKRSRIFEINFRRQFY